MLRTFKIFLVTVTISVTGCDFDPFSPLWNSPEKTDPAECAAIALALKGYLDSINSGLTTADDIAADSLLYYFWCLEGPE